MLGEEMSYIRLSAHHGTICRRPPKTTSKIAPNRTICARLVVQLLMIGSVNTRRSVLFFQVMGVSASASIRRSAVTTTG
jgi:hypothetical protein